MNENWFFPTAKIIFADSLQPISEIQQTEALVQRCSVEKVFLEISQNSQENTCVKVFCLITESITGVS